MKLSEKDSYTKEDLDAAMNTLIEAEAIKENPELLRLVQQHGKEMKEGITSVEQLRSTANKMFVSKEDASDDEPKKKKEKAPKVKSVADLRAAAKESKDSDQ